MSIKEVLSAVSLKYPGDAEAPFITAKSKGELAKKMIEIARDNSVPIVRDELLENVLSVGEIGKCIPEESWKAVAAVFAMISSLEERKR